MIFNATVIQTRAPNKRTFSPILAAAASTLLQFQTYCQVSLDSWNPNASGTIVAIAPQPDGKVLLGGVFGLLGGQARTNIGRINPDGTCDASFSPGGNIVHGFAIQPDGKLLVESYQTGLKRFTAAGTRDSSFSPVVSGSSFAALSLQADGKILMDGASAIYRINVDGTKDTAFNVSIGGTVDSLAVQPDGKIVVGGHFTTLAGQARNNIGRLNSDGTLDAGFNPGATGNSGEVYCLAVQADSKILVGGYFTNLAGHAQNCLGRLNPAGSLDTSFNPGVGVAAGTFILGFPWVGSLALQTDGRILISGAFTVVGGQYRSAVARLNSDGSLDTSLQFSVSGHVISPLVYSLAVQPDGKILVGGQFTTFGGQTRNSLVRLSDTAPATQTLTYNGSAVTWLRGGTSPEVWRTTFDATTNGTDWISLGAGVRIEGGWQLTGASIPPSPTIRARGYTSGGTDNSSSWFVEDITGPLVIVTQPASLTNNAGTTA
jgi:uncharacterized delta-60 repeat protein